MKKNLVLFLIILSASFVNAQKYGFINSEYILSKMPEYKEAKDRLDKMADRWTKEVDERNKILSQKKNYSLKKKCFFRMRKRKNDKKKFRN